jgi:hypothetical protein
MNKNSKEIKVPAELQPTYMIVTSLIDVVCDSVLNEEYKELCHLATAKLCRKRPSPLLRSRPASWACGIVYAIGQVNFLFDKSRDPYISASDLCGLFSVSTNTGSDKARQVRDFLKTYQMDPAWTLPSLIDNNMLVWLIEVDGLIVDARQLPRAIQEIACELGLIPYIPSSSEQAVI